jgi:hypothetical protein
MVLKSTWDYAYYWSVLALLFFRDCITDLVLLKNVEPLLRRLQGLNAQVQARFQQRAVQRIESTGHGRFFDQCQIPLLVRLNRSLIEPDGTVDSELGRNAETLERLAPALLELLENGARGRLYPTEDLGDLYQRLN